MTAPAVARASRALARHLADQRHDQYTWHDHEVWRTAQALNVRLRERFGHRIHPAYLEGMRALELPDRVPRVEELNERLRPTGWSTVCVDGYLPTDAYVELISAQILPLARSLRLLEHVEHAPAPDMIHDVFGHLPMLFCPEHRDYLQRLGVVMGRAAPNQLDEEYFTAIMQAATLRMDPGVTLSRLVTADARVERVNRAMVNNCSELTQVRRIYVWSIEFGLLGTPDDFVVHGSALMSAPRELEALCEGRAQVTPYSGDVIHHENAFSELLGGYFVARDFEQLDFLLGDYALNMQNQKSSQIVKLGL